MDWLTSWEGGILLWIQENLRAPVLNEIIGFLTRLGNSGAIWIVLTLLMLCFKRTRKAGLACTIALLLSLLVTNVALKNIIHRIRPYEVIESLKIIVEPERSYSFPSGHASSSLAAGWAMFRMLPKKWGASGLALGVLIALSRLYVGVHYPTDVLAGIAIGLLVAQIGVAAVWKLEARRAARS